MRWRRWSRPGFSRFRNDRGLVSITATAAPPIIVARRASAPYRSGGSMNVPSTPDDGNREGATAGAASTNPTPSKGKRPIAWMIVAGLAVLAAIGLGIWAVSVNSDLDETQSEL